jgi:excisionase family DNA binding protein
MESIKVELVLPAEFLTELQGLIMATVAEAVKQNVNAIRIEQTKLTRKEACTKLKISLPTLSNHIHSGKIKAQRIGRRILIPESEIESFLKQSA